MPNSVLTTKLFISPLRRDLLPRLQVVKKLNESTLYPLTLISASAGSGKTTALSEWIDKNNNQVAWISLDADDNDPVQFLIYVIYSLRQIKEGFGQDSIENLSVGTLESVESCLINIINEIAEFTSTSFLVMDDYHVINNSKVDELVSFFIEHLPPQLHLIISSRVDPPWALSRYRARNQLLEIRGHDLRFKVVEIQQFLDRTAGIIVSSEDATALEERTEGWIAGLQLAALSMRGHQDVSKFVKDFTGSHLFVAEYLIEEILQQQPEPIKSFLLQTSILERLNADLCDAVTENQDGKEIINWLHRANIFIIPLDHEGGWFRYHHLFADLLRSRLNQTYTQKEISNLHIRASDWYEANNYAADTIHHSFLAKDFNKVAQLVDEHGQQMFFSERYNILRNWLHDIPPEYFKTYPRLEIYQFLIDLLEGTVDMFESTLTEKEKLVRTLPPSPENDRLRQRALVNLSLFLAFQNTEKALQIAREILNEIPEDDLHLRAYLYSGFYRSYGMTGDVEKASVAYRECFRLAMLTNQYEMISNATKIRTYDLLQYGRLDEAADYCQQIIDAGKEKRFNVFYPAGPCYLGLAGIYLERNQIQKAEDTLNLGLELCHQGAKYGLFTGYVQKIRLLQAKGQIEEALKELQIFEQTFQRREFTFMAQKVSLLLAANEVEKLSQMVPYFQELLGASYYAQKPPLVATEFFRFCLARIYLAQGKREEVLPLLDEVQKTVEPGKRMGKLMETYFLRALAKHDPADETVPAESIEYLEKALELAMEYGYFLLFLEAGPGMIPILKAVVNHQAAPDSLRQFAQQIIRAFNRGGDEPSEMPVPKSDQLVEQMTEREMEVLILLAAGKSNQEIADELFITVRTVKKHTSNIYGKLNVTSRTQAIAHAREIDLL